MTLEPLYLTPPRWQTRTCLVLTITALTASIIFAVFGSPIADPALGTIATVAASLVPLLPPSATLSLLVTLCFAAAWYFSSSSFLSLTEAGIGYQLVWRRQFAAWQEIRYMKVIERGREKLLLAAKSPPIVTLKNTTSTTTYLDSRQWTGIETPGPVNIVQSDILFCLPITIFVRYQSQQSIDLQRWIDWVNSSNTLPKRS